MKFILCFSLHMSLLVCHCNLDFFAGGDNGNDDRDLAVILGLATGIPVGCALVAIIIVLVIVYCRNPPHLASSSLSYGRGYSYAAWKSDDMEMTETSLKTDGQTRFK
jgi:hypothetical protein